MTSSQADILYSEFLPLRHHLLELCSTLTIPPDEDLFVKCRREWNYYKRLVTEKAIQVQYEPGSAKDAIYRMFTDRRWRHFVKVRQYRWVRTPEGKSHKQALNAKYYATVVKAARSTTEGKAKKRASDAAYYARKTAERATQGK